MKTHLVISLPARKGVPGSLVDAVHATVREWHEQHDPRFANFVTMNVELVPESDADRVEVDRIAGKGAPVG